MAKENSNSTILALDLGNYNIKTSLNELFLSSFVRVDKATDENDPCLLNYEGKNYLMERGKFDNEFNKAKKDYIPNLLYAISKGIKPGSETQNIKLLLGVPLSNLGLKETMIKDLINKEFKFKVSGNEYNIKLIKVGIVGEGISSFYSLPDEIRKLDILIIDIGGRTTNCCGYKNGKLVISFTIPLGTMNLFDYIIQKLNLDGEKYEVEQIKEYIDKNIISPSDSCYEKFINEIYNSILFKCDIRLFKPIFTGGGSILLIEHENKLERAGFSDIMYMDNPLFSNVIGNKKIAESKWGE